MSDRIVITPDVLERVDRERVAKSRSAIASIVRRESDTWIEREIASAERLLSPSTDWANGPTFVLRLSELVGRYEALMSELDRRTEVSS